MFKIWDWKRLVVALGFSNTGVGICLLGAAACIHAASKVAKEIRKRKENK